MAGNASVPSVVGGAATSIASPLEGALSSTAAKLLGVVETAGPIAVGSATLADIFAHSACTASAYPTASVASPF